MSILIGGASSSLTTGCAVLPNVTFLGDYQTELPVHLELTGQSSQSLVPILACNGVFRSEGCFLKGRIWRLLRRNKMAESLRYWDFSGCK
jgi:hypothetical protein